MSGPIEAPASDAGTAPSSSAALTKSFGGLARSTTSSSRCPSGDRLDHRPNGAGKTTFFNMHDRPLQADDRPRDFDGRDITGKRPTSITRPASRARSRTSSCSDDDGARERAGRACTRA
jgi:ABC-type branched-subunit amino acid transport system ATPase component